jgi:hypothetical protein
MSPVSDGLFGLLYNAASSSDSTHAERAPHRHTKLSRTGASVGGSRVQWRTIEGSSGARTRLESTSDLHYGATTVAVKKVTGALWTCSYGQECDPVLHPLGGVALCLALASTYRAVVTGIVPTTIWSYTDFQTVYNCYSEIFQVSSA